MKGKSRNSSTEGQKPPYLRASFWKKPENKFWLRDGYTETGKEYQENRVAKMDADQKNFSILDPTLLS
jgi:hypothetical protein